MSSYKVMITDGLDQTGIEFLNQSAQVDNLNGISADDLLGKIGEYDALIVRSRTKVTPAVFAAAKKLKVVGRAGIGVDNIDLKAAKAAGVTVVNSPIATTITVAELTLGMMLSIVREIPRADCAMKRGEWLKKELEGVELYGKTLGIIGFGRIGSAVAKRAAAFEMKIIAYDPLRNESEIREGGAEPVTLDQLFAQADFITLHTPLNESSRNILGAEAFAKMKQGVYIIDVARGGVVDEAALLDALNSGKVAGAAMDVFTTEPPGLSELVVHPRVIDTPHIGAQTIEAQARAGYDIATEVLAALEGEALRWKVA